MRGTNHRFSCYLRLGHCLGLLLFLLPILSCNPGGSKKLNRRVTLWRKDKIPYGTFIAYENLPYLFPDAEVSINQVSPSELKSPANGNNSSDAEGGDRKKAYVIITPRMLPDPSEINAIMSFVGEGNHVFISSFQFGDSLLHTLNVRPAPALYNFQESDSLRLSIYNPVSYDSLSFAYPGASYDNWVSSLDSQYATILGRDAKGRPDLVKFSYKGGGTLFLHFAPMAFTNFFLLHKQNKAYYDNALSYLPVSVKEVIWDEYFRYDRANNNFSAFRYILSNPPLRWAFWLLLLLFLLIYLFESKRKQRMVPVVEGLRNNSLDFVKTIGRLYYQRRDNHDLALKMSAHFLDHVRTRYNLPVTTPDQGFIERLSYKTGYPKESLQDLVTDIQRLQLEPSLTDEELLAFHRKIDTFYKHV
ncbi:MAG TPA: DUF4350 domain-containing protein [Puia sp.]